jgi:HPt (histidine-containing phosphotransfer) domain-containing protein
LAVTSPAPATAASGPDPFGDALLMMASRMQDINIARGLSMLRGNAEKYLRLLNQFVQSHGGDPAKMAKFLDDDDHESAGRLAHTLRGTSSTLGVDSVADAARRIESLLRSKIDAKALREQAQVEVRSLTTSMTMLAAAMPPMLPLTPAGDALAQTPKSGQS